MIENYDSAISAETLQEGDRFLAIAHGYQPSRNSVLASRRERLDIVPEINERIFNEVYKPVLVEGESLPQGFAFSFYAPLRDWLRNSHPSEYQRIVEKINATPDKEYRVLGDPYIHLILPLLPRDDQDMLVRLGKRAFERDLGFTPSGIWLPEAGVSSQTLGVVLSSGYDFVILRDNQLRDCSENPTKVRTDNGGDMEVIHFNSALSGLLSFNDDASNNADDFLNSLPKQASAPIAVGSDMELYGHHKKDRDKFLKYMVTDETLRRHGLKPFNVAKSLENAKDRVTEVVEDSSWSCEHSLGRWTGECDCDGTNEATKDEKRRLYGTLRDYGDEVNSRLTQLSSNWRAEFIEFFLKNRDLMFNPRSEIPHIRNEDKLFWAKYAQLVGLTSCGWFFGNEASVEREIPRRMIGEIEDLVGDIHEHTVYNQMAA